MSHSPRIVQLSKEQIESVFFFKGTNTNKKEINLMLNYNRTIMMGRLTRDPKLNILSSGTESMTTALAVNRTWTDKHSGEKREEVCFIDLQAFGRIAEVIAEYFCQGDPIHVEGRLRFRQWETPEGERRTKHDLLIDSFEFVGIRSDNRMSSNTSKDQRQPIPIAEFGDNIPF